MGNIFEHLIFIHSLLQDDNTDINIYIFMHIYTYMYVYIYVYICTFTYSTYFRMIMEIYTHIYTYILDLWYTYYTPSPIVFFLPCFLGSAEPILVLPV